MMGFLERLKDMKADKLNLYGNDIEIDGSIELKVSL